MWRDLLPNEDKLRACHVPQMLTEDRRLWGQRQRTSPLTVKVVVGLWPSSCWFLEAQIPPDGASFQREAACAMGWALPQKKNGKHSESVTSVVSKLVLCPERDRVPWGPHSMFLAVSSLFSYTILRKSQVKEQSGTEMLTHSARRKGVKEAQGDLRQLHLVTCCPLSKHFLSSTSAEVAQAL